VAQVLLFPLLLLLLLLLQSMRVPLQVGLPGSCPPVN
jgi:hypothetical protein